MKTPFNQTRSNVLVALVMLGAALTFFAPQSALAQIPDVVINESGFENEVIAGGLSLPTAMAFTPDGRIFVTEKSGVVQVIKNGVVLAAPLISLTDVNTFGDRGLLGIETDPNFASNGYVYLLYTYENSPGINISGAKTARIVRITVTGDTASESSKVVLVGAVGGNVTSPSCEDFAVTADCIASDSNSHSAGGLRFGPDGKLYATTGDGADFAAVDSRALRAQDIDSLAGKVLRINTDGTAPADNPFYDGDPDSNRSKVYAFGFRNQFRFNFNTETGKLYGGDVGWSSWEEINEVVAGANYGWPCREGDFAQAEYACDPSTVASDPVYAYAHDATGAGSITAGSFFENNVYPAEYSTSMFIGDYAQQWMKRLVLDTNGNVVEVVDFVPNMIWPVEITTGADGNVYYIDIARGSVNRITHTEGNRSPVVNITATPTSGLSPLQVEFSSAGTQDLDGDTLSYFWTFGDGATAATTSPVHTYTTNGLYTASLQVTDSNGATVSKSIDITVGNQSPAAEITSPVSGSFYEAGQTLSVYGLGTDPEDGAIPAENISWEVILHHNVHTHTLSTAAGVDTIEFQADGHDDPDVYIRVVMRVTDSNGLVGEDSINMYLDNGSGIAGNLISNPSLEEADPAFAIQPLDWIPGWYGNMNPVFEYPVNGLSGEKAARVTVTDYVSGAARWYFSPAFVQVGTDYRFSNVYIADTTTTFTAQYGRSDGTYFYEVLKVLPAVSDPTSAEVTFTVPEGVQTMTIFHDLFANGTLTVDEYSLVEVSGDTNPPTGFFTNIVPGDVVSGTVLLDVTAADAEGDVTMVHLYVDGAKVEGIEDTTAPFQLLWDTTAFADGGHTIQVHTHDEVDNAGLSDPIAITIDNSSTSTNPNLVFNGDFEIVGDDGLPAGWIQGGWGTNERVYTYPSNGRDGGRAAAVSINKYDLSDDGDAKWVFSDIPVIVGTEYTYRNYYYSDTISDIIGRYTYADGSISYFGLIKEIAPVADWTPLEATFTPPIDAVSITLFQLVSSVGTVAVDDVSIVVSGTSGPSEANAPAVNITTPAAGTTISGTVTVVANATDDTAIVGVYFAANGIPIGSEDFAAPYNYVWDTTAVPNGEYILKATAHDPYGNNNKDEITITVDNSGVTPPPSGGNLIANADFATVVAGEPAGWNKGGWGTNSRVLTFVDNGGNDKYIRTAISDYVSGDAKWYFNDVSVTANETYGYTSTYRSDVPSALTARYTKADGSIQYEYLGGEPASAAWNDTQAYDITTPADTVSLTVFHSISTAGTLDVQSAILTGVAGEQTIEDLQQMVSDLFLQINGLLANAGKEVDSCDLMTLDLAKNAEELDAQINDLLAVLSVLQGGGVPVIGTCTVTDIPVGANLIANGDLEVGSANNPTAWAQGGWGTNARAFTYPVAGETGDAARVEITSYTSGDAKWFFNDVTVVSGTDYTFSETYKANVASGLTARYTTADGTVSYEYLATLPIAATWQTHVETISVPAGVTALTIFHTITSVGVLDIDNFSLTGADGGPGGGGGGVTPPTISYTGVSDGDTVTGRLVLNVSLVDGSAAPYQSVQLETNGTPVARDTTAPYVLAWDTTRFADGDYELVVVVNDEVEAKTQSAAINITVDNVADPVDPPPVDPPTGSGIINGSMEAADPTDATRPNGWSKSAFGEYDVTFTYPIAGISGNGARVELANYISSDAKWVFEPVSVTAGALYTLTHSYRSDVETTISLVYQRADDSFYYIGRVDLAPSATWKTVKDSFVIPDDAVAVSVFQSLTADGFLEVDEFMLELGTPDAFSQGMISLSFDDGWLTHYTEALPLLEKHDTDATFYIVSGYTTEANGSELVANNLISTNNGNGTPTGWFQGGWGDSTQALDYNITGGVNGDGSVRTEITNYVSGDAKWYFDDVPVTAGESYALTQTYRSTTDTQINVRYTMSDDSFVYDFIAGAPNTGNSWEVNSSIVVAPVDVVSMTIFHVVTSDGVLEIDNASIVLVEDFISTDEVQRLAAAGHEIGSHTITHSYLTTLSEAGQVAELENSKSTLENTIVPGVAVTSIAYPYGDYDGSVLDKTAAAGYDAARGVDRGYNTKATERYALKVQQVDRTTTIADINEWMTQAETDGTWLILMFHQIDDIAANDLGITAEFLDEILTTVNNSGIAVTTIGDAIGLLN